MEKENGVIRLFKNERSVINPKDFTFIRDDSVNFDCFSVGDDLEVEIHATDYSISSDRMPEFKDVINGESVTLFGRVDHHESNLIHLKEHKPDRKFWHITHYPVKTSILNDPELESVEDVIQNGDWIEVCIKKVGGRNGV